ncbi:unnamed protein product [Ilex paraguariensis]|uniref:Uncharacterized protein n=1 Tax=Ilex paraguariensis TaxID=185542 RepID=A0ABC8RGR6_9AQUA
MGTKVPKTRTKVCGNACKRNPTENFIFEDRLSVPIFSVCSSSSGWLKQRISQGLKLSDKSGNKKFCLLSCMESSEGCLWAGQGASDPNMSPAYSLPSPSCEVGVPSIAYGIVGNSPTRNT